MSNEFGDMKFGGLELIKEQATQELEASLLTISDDKFLNDSLLGDLSFQREEQSEEEPQFSSGIFEKEAGSSKKNFMKKTLNSSPRINLYSEEFLGDA